MGQATRDLPSHQDDIELFVIHASSQDPNHSRALSVKLNCAGYTDSYQYPVPRYMVRPDCDLGSLSRGKQPGYIIATKTDAISLIKATNLHEFIKNSGSLSQEVTKLDQLRLAHNVASTVVQFYSTPFLEEEWSLDMFGVVDRWSEKSPDEGYCLNPTVIFLSNGLVSDEKLTSQSHCGSQLGYFNAPALESQSCHGSRLQPFYNLGIALLEIAYLQPYSFLCNGVRNLRTAQKILIWQNPLGKKYQEIVERCLEGDLGVGSHSTVSEIRDAAYTRIVCVLRDIINYISA
jgi:hypothetical protein